MSGIQVRGDGDLLRKLGKLGRGAIARTLEPPMNGALKFVQDAAANYPPRIPGSPYIRGYGFAGGRATSEKLGQKWDKARRIINSTGQGLQGRVGTNVSYGPFVQDRKHQARVHKNRWPTIQDITEGNVFNRRVTEFFQDAIDKVLGR